MIKSIKTALLTLAILTTTSNAYSQGSLSTSDQEALHKTKRMLKNKQLRDRAIHSSKSAGKAHNNAVNAVGESNIEEFYGISADVMGELVQLANGDAAKMQMILQKAAKNPEAFYKLLSPKAREAIKKISRKKAH